jgi:hypothetical protein
MVTSYLGEINLQMHVHSYHCTCRRNFISAIVLITRK